MSNRIRVEGRTAYIATKQGSEIIIDVVDLPIVSGTTWSAVDVDGAGRLYARDSRRWYMHRFLLGVTDRRQQVDHIDHNGLNNRRANLRIVTNAENHQNLRGPHKQGSTGVRGLSVQTDRSGRQRYKARVMVNYRVASQRYFDFSESGRESARRWLLDERARLMGHADARDQSQVGSIQPPAKVAPKAYASGDDWRRLHGYG